MEWWLWCIFGCVLLMVELVVPGGFVLLFFGFGALLTGAVVSLGVVPIDWVQWLLFSVCSVALLLALRTKLRAFIDRRHGPVKDINGMVGLVGNAVGEIAPHQVGQLELRGAHWTARNMGQGSITSGQRCVVHQVDGLVLIVKPE
jgi:membrane protein implicated in regulation of membrane protease activity